MTIIEQNLVGKKNPETCEDAIVITPDFIAVVDGSTSKSSEPFRSGTSNGRYAMELVVQTLPCIPPQAALADVCCQLTQAVAHVYAGGSVSLSALQDNPVLRLTASTAIYSRHHRCVWLIGDCQCLVTPQSDTRHRSLHYDNPKQAEAVAAEARSRLIAQWLREGARQDDFQHVDPARQQILPLIKDSCREQNRQFSVIDGFPVSLRHVRTIPCPPQAHVVLATDGYPFLRPTLAASERALSLQLKNDPLCFRTFKATKGLMHGQQSFDDRAYVRFVAD